MSIDIDWGEAWIEQQRFRNQPDDKDSWDARSATFANNCGKSHYAAQFIDRMQIGEGESVFDMGCGSGTLALPLAQAGHHVYACDFSQGMLDQLEAVARELGLLEFIHPKLLAWDDDWEDASLPSCDIAVASRSIATADLRTSLSKLDSIARRRVCITLTTGVSPRVDPVLLQAVGRDRPAYPDCVFAFNILWQMGIRPEMSYIDSARADAFDSFDQAIDKTCDVLGADEAERERLIAYSLEHLHEVADADGCAHWEYDHPRVTSWAFLAWDKQLRA